MRAAAQKIHVVIHSCTIPILKLIELITIL